jgi:hypothetical protein
MIRWFFVMIWSASIENADVSDGGINPRKAGYRHAMHDYSIVSLLYFDSLSNHMVSVVIMQCDSVSSIYFKWLWSMIGVHWNVCRHANLRQIYLKEWLLRTKDIGVAIKRDVYKTKFIRESCCNKPISKQLGFSQLQKRFFVWERPSYSPILVLIYLRH